MCRLGRRTGAMLIELLIVVLIIGLLAGGYFMWYGPKHAKGHKKPGALPSAVEAGTSGAVMGQALQKAKSVQCMNNLNQLREAIQIYVSDQGTYPPNLAALNLPNMTHCPVSGVPYQYDPQTGVVKCPTHPQY